MGFSQQMASPSGPAEAQSGTYVVVARRYRPRGFAELVGQEHVARALSNAIETNRVGHAYLFTGARGVGKTSTARIFAKALNAPGGPTPQPANDNDIAEAIDAGEDVDVIEIDGASNRGIDEIRSLRANVGVRPSRSRYKIYIIDEVHMLTQAAFNALLKTLEEPPEHVKFIFCTTDPEKIPITVLSRCQRFDFAPVEVVKIVGRLRQIVDAESATADDAALELIARRAAGSMRDSQSLLEQVLSFCDGHLTAEQVHAMLGTADDERLHRLAIALAERDAVEALRQLDAAIDAGVDAGRLAEQLLGYFRDLMAVAVGCDASLMRYASVALHEEMKSLGEKWGLQTVLAVVGLIDQTLVRIRHSVHGRVLLESTLIQIASLPDLQAIADLAALAAADGEKKKLSDPRPAERTSPASPHPVPSHHLDRGPTPGSPAAVGSARDRPVHDRPVHDRVTPDRLAPDRPRSAGAVPAQPAASVDDRVVDAAAVHVSAERPAENAAISGIGDAPGSRAVPAPDSPATEPSPGPAREAPVIASVAGSRAETTAGWSPQELCGHWGQAVEEMDPVTATLARGVDHVESPRPGLVRLVYPAASGLTMRRCANPEHRGEIAETLRRVTGVPVQLEFAALPAPNSARPVTPKPAARSRMQRMREIESNDLVRGCIEIFGAEIVRVDVPRD